MRLSLRYILWFAILLIVAAGLLGHLFGTFRRQALLQAQRSADLTARTVATFVEAEARRGRARDLSLEFAGLVRQAGVAAIAVKNSRGRTIAFRADSKALARRKPHPGVPLSAVRDGIYDIQVPISLGSLGKGAALVSLRTQGLESAFVESSHYAIEFGTAAVLSIVLLAWFLGEEFGLRLRLVIPHIERIADDPLTFTPFLERGGADELSRLERAVNRMGSELKEDKIRIMSLEAEKEELSAMLVHDLKTPLTVLRSGVDLLKEQWDANHVVPAGIERRRDGQSPRPRTFELMEQSSARLLRMVEDILQLAKLSELGDLSQREKVDFAEMARSCAKDFGLVTRRRGQKLELEISDGGAYRVSGDPTLLRRVLDNLLHNAVEHTPESGTIRLALCRENGSLRASISDTGPGIPEEARADVFRKFYQKEVKRHVGNVGLGLALCQKVVEKHGGTIGVTEAEPRGACFYFLLPVA
jgi:signal transduction histidine kinase